MGWRILGGVAAALAGLAARKAMILGWKTDHPQGAALQPGIAGNTMDRGDRLGRRERL